MMKTLGVNTIRVYVVDPTLNHDACMQSFASQGIYVALDLSTPTASIDRTNPNWSLSLFKYYGSVIDAFSKYNNTLTFFIANELVNDVNTTTVSPVIKAVARDMRAYRDARGYRKIPLAYSASDEPSVRGVLAEYLTCDEADSIEMYAMNTYSWCGNSSYYAAGYDTIYEQFQGLNVPVFFSETGCNIVTRDFSDVSTMLGPVFQAVFSGAIVYEWMNEENDYGLVEYKDANGTGFPVTLSDFDPLSRVMATANPTGTSRDAYSPSNSVPACPTTNSNWSVQGGLAIPTIADLNIRTISAVTTYVTPTAVNTAGSTKTSGAFGTVITGTTASSQGLSTGAEVGIAIGACVIGIAAIAGLYLFISRRRRMSSIENPEVLPMVNDEDDPEQKIELPAKSIQRPVPKSELEAYSPQHWQAYYKNRTPAELESEKLKGGTYEIDGRSLANIHEIG